MGSSGGGANRLARKQRALMDAAIEFSKEQGRSGVPAGPPFVCPQGDGTEPCQMPTNTRSEFDGLCLHCRSPIKREFEECRLCDGDGVVCTCCKQYVCEETAPFWQVCMDCHGEGRA